MSSSSSSPSSAGSGAACRRPSHRKEFQIAIICALPLEYDAVTLLVDEFWDEDGRQYGRTSGDANTYRNGRIGMHNVVLMLLPNMGKAAVAGSAASLRTSYSRLRIAFLVGVCGGVPFLGSQEALLGDVVIGETIVQYDFGRQYPGQFVPKEVVDATQQMPNKDIRTLLAYFKSEVGMEDLRKSTAKHLIILQQTAELRRYRRSYRYPGLTEDKLFAAAYRHQHQNRPCCDGAERFCDEAAKSSCAEVGCEKRELVTRQRLEAKRCLTVEEAQCPDIHIGRVASADTVMKSGVHRDQIAKQHNIIAFEMEGAGLWDEAPCIVVKGICDYADSHKNKSWQPFAAATAAAAVKAILGRYTMTDDVELPAAQLVSAPLSQIKVELAGTRTNTSSLTSDLLLRKPDGIEMLQDAILEFQAILTPEQRCDLRNARNVPDADTVLIFTAELDLLNRNRKGTSVASRLYSLLQSVRDFSAVVETLGPAHNGVAPLIWGIVRLTMLITIGNMSHYDRASKTYMELGRLFPRRTDYQIHCSSSDHLQRALCSFYASFLRYCKRAVQSSQQQWPTQSTGNSSTSIEQELQRHVVEMELHSREVIKAIALAEAKAHHQDRQLQTMKQKKPSRSEKLKRMLSPESDKLATIADLPSQVDRRRAMERRQQLLDFLSTHDYVTPLKQSRRKRFSGTLDWLFETREFDRWITDSSSPLLWCSGKSELTGALQRRNNHSDRGYSWLWQDDSHGEFD
ncbi:nucleoside phosphorylase domain-containing protein [Trichoderma aethiopicum]